MNNVIELVISCDSSFSKVNKTKFLNRLFCSDFLPNGDRSIQLLSKFLKASFGTEFLDENVEKYLEINLDSNEFLVFQFDKKYVFDKFNLSSKLFLKRLLNFLRKTDGYLNYYIRSNFNNLSTTDLEKRFIKNNVILYTKDCNYVDLEFSITSNLEYEFLNELKDITLSNLLMNNKNIEEDELISISSTFCETCLGYNEKYPIHFMVTSLKKSNINDIKFLDVCLLFNHDVSTLKV